MYKYAVASVIIAAVTVIKIVVEKSMSCKSSTFFLNPRIAIYFLHRLFYAIYELGM